MNHHMRWIIVICGVLLCFTCIRDNFLVAMEGSDRKIQQKNEEIQKAANKGYPDVDTPLGKYYLFPGNGVGITENIAFNDAEKIAFQKVQKQIGTVIEGSKDLLAYESTNNKTTKNKTTKQVFFKTNTIILRNYEIHNARCNESKGEYKCSLVFALSDDEYQKITKRLKKIKEKCIREADEKTGKPDIMDKLRGLNQLEQCYMAFRYSENSAIDLENVSRKVNNAVSKINDVILKLKTYTIEAHCNDCKNYNDCTLDELPIDNFSLMTRKVNIVDKSSDYYIPNVKFLNGKFKMKIPELESLLRELNKGGHYDFNIPELNVKIIQPDMVGITVSTNIGKKVSDRIKKTILNKSNSSVLMCDTRSADKEHLAGNLHIKKYAAREVYKECVPAPFPQNESCRWLWQITFKYTLTMNQEKIGGKAICRYRNTGRIKYDLCAETMVDAIGKIVNQ